jgi:hypothetical protein
MQPKRTPHPPSAKRGRARVSPMCADATPVHMSMSLEEAERLDETLVTYRGSTPAVALRELLWLRAVLVEQRRRTAPDERYRFDRRADRILAQLWTTTASGGPSETTITVERNGKR